MNEKKLVKDIVRTIKSRRHASMSFAISDVANYAVKRTRDECEKEKAELLRENMGLEDKATQAKNNEQDAWNYFEKERNRIREDVLKLRASDIIFNNESVFRDDVLKILDKEEK